MSAPANIKPAAPKRPRRAAKPQAVPAVELSAMEIRAALAFRRFKPELKDEWLAMMENVAAQQQADTVAARPGLVLRLVTGGAR